MTPILRLAAALMAATGLCAATAQAAPGAATAAAAAPATSASSAAAAPATRPPVTVIEDDNARIEEVRVRGSVQRVTVQSKVGSVRPYEIQVAPPGRDPSQERGNAGRRAWSVLDF